LTISHAATLSETRGNLETRKEDTMETITGFLISGAIGLIWWSLARYGWRTSRDTALLAGTIAFFGEFIIVTLSQGR